MDAARLRRIGFVTEHYGVFRGGVTRAIVAPIGIVVGTLEYLSEYLNPPVIVGLIFGLANIFAFAGVAIGLWFWSRGWLDRRFGRVHSANPALVSFGLLGFQIAYFAASRLDDSLGPGVGLPSAQFLVFAGAALWYAVRLWPYSVHYGVVASIAAAFAVPFATLSGEQAVDMWEIKAFISVLLAWTAAGLIDLAILWRVLPRGVQQETVPDA